MTLEDISKHRTALMGIATLMIIACHAPASGVALPKVINRVLGLGNYGVDIFLFLSGIGCYFSLSETKSWARYFKKRYVRIGIPYLLITIPFVIVFLLLGEFSLGDAILSLTTFDYWIEHKGAWFVALLIPLYFASPVLFKVLTGKKSFWKFVLIIVCIVGLCNINVENFCFGDVVGNIQTAFQRVPSYLIGMLLGKYCKEGRRIRPIYLIISIIVGVILYVVCCFLIGNSFVEWLVIPSLIIIFAKLLDYFPTLHIILNPLGKISLESYLTNIYINHLLCVLIPFRIDHEIFYGRYLEYSIVIVLGLTIAFSANRISTYFIKSIMTV